MIYHVAYMRVIYHFCKDSCSIWEIRTVVLAQITWEDLAAAEQAVGTFGGDNRAGVQGTLHRISAIRNRKGTVVGLTCRVGRAVTGHIDMIRDMLEGLLLLSFCCTLSYALLHAHGKLVHSETHVYMCFLSLILPGNRNYSGRALFYCFPLLWHQSQRPCSIAQYIRFLVSGSSQHCRSLPTMLSVLVVRTVEITACCACGCSPKLASFPWTAWSWQDNSHTGDGTCTFR